MKELGVKRPSGDTLKFLKLALFFCLLAIATASAVSIHEFGISKILLLDSPQNLRALANQAIDSRGALYDFVFGNNSGPLGRPVSMYSFWLDTRDGFDVERLRKTNVVIHALIGIVLAVFSFQIFTLSGRKSRESLGSAALVLLIWLFHPASVSTVQYVVQRMTQLAALFSLLSLVSYVYGRQRISMIHADLAGWTYCGLAVFPFGILAVLSKENALLLLGSFLILEYIFFSRGRIEQLSRQQKLYGIGVLAVTAFIGLIFAIQIFSIGYEYRPFTVMERGLTQLRLLSLHMLSIFFPRISQFSVFHDDLTVSTSLLNPITTLSSLGFLFALLILALKAEKKHPVVSFGILWFFGWHLLESTLVPLELHFEHRNYLPMMGPIIGIVYLISLPIEGSSWKRFSYGFSVARILIPVVFAFLTLQLNSLWSKPGELAFHWSVLHPASKRSTVQLSHVYARGGDVEKGLETLVSGLEYNPREITLLLEIWNYGCRYGLESPVTLDQISGYDDLVQRRDVLSAQTYMMRDLVLEGACDSPSPNELAGLADQIEMLSLRDRELSIIFFDLSSVMFSSGELDLGAEFSLKAFRYAPDPEIFIQQVNLSTALDNPELLQKFVSGVRKIIKAENIEQTYFEPIFDQAMENYLQMTTNQDIRDD